MRKQLRVVNKSYFLKYVRRTIKKIKKKVQQNENYSHIKHKKLIYFICIFPQYHMILSHHYHKNPIIIIQKKKKIKIQNQQKYQKQQQFQMHKQILQHLNIKKLKTTTQFGPWRSQTVPTFQIHQFSTEQNNIRKIYYRQYRQRKKHRGSNSNHSLLKHKYKQQQINHANTEQQPPQTHQQVIIKPDKQKYNILSKYLQSVPKQRQPLTTSNLLQKQKQKQHIIATNISINKLKNELKHSIISIPKQQNIILQQNQLHLPDTYSHRYNQQIKHKKLNRKLKYLNKHNRRDQKYIQASLLPNIKSNTTILLNNNQQNLINDLLKSKSNKMLVYQDCYLTKERNSVERKNHLVMLQRKNQIFQLPSKPPISV